MNSPLTLDQVYLLLGEKDVLIFQLGLQFNKIATEKAELEKEVLSLKRQLEEVHGKLAGTDSHLAILGGSRYDQGARHGCGDSVLDAPEQPSPELDKMEQNH
jgi:hypothetical protein